MNFIYHVYLIPLLLSAAFSLKAFRLNWPRMYKQFSVFLLITFLVETFTILWKFVFYRLSNGQYNNSNLWIYNLYLIPQYLFYMWFFSQAIKSGSLKKIIRKSAFVFTLFGLINLVWIEGLHAVNSFTIILCSAIIVFLTTAYFNQVLNAKEIIKLNREPLIYISVGALIFHVGTIPYFLYINFLNTHDQALSLSLFIVLLILNTLMYTLYLTAFLCTPQLQKQVL